MKMSVQLIIDDSIFLQTMPVASEHDEMSWNLGLVCTIPPHAVAFSVAVLRHSETGGTRVLGCVKIGRDKVLGSVELNSSTFELELSKVNPNGPSLKFNAGFSVSELPYQRVSGLAPVGMPDNRFTSVNGHRIKTELQKMHEDSGKAQFCMEVPQLLVMHERILLCYHSNNNRARCLNILGDVLLQSYQASGNVDDLKQAVSAYDDAVRDDPETVIYLADLGRSLRLRFERFGSLLDINCSVVMLKAAIERTFHGDPYEPSLLSDLGNSLIRRFEHLGDLNDLNQSVSKFEASVTLIADGHPDKPSLLNNLGNSLLDRFKCLGGLDDLNQSLLRYEAAVNLTPDGHQGKPLWLNNLGNSLVGRFKRLGDGHPDKPSLLSNLGSSLICRFKQLGGLDDLNQSVLRLEAAVNLTPDGHPNKPSLLGNLGSSLLGRFERLGGVDDLNQSVLKLKATVTLTPDGHPDKPSWLSSLGNSLLRRFERLGGLDDLNLSVLRFEAAVTLTPDGHPDKPSMLSNLGNSLTERFKRVGDLNDLNQSVLTLEIAVTLTPEGHSDKPAFLSNLGNSLLSRFERLGGLDDLNHGRFKRLGALNDLNQSVSKHEAAVTLTPDGHPDKPSRLSNLGNSLLGRFEQLGSFDDLNQSVLRFEAAVNLTPDGHPDKPLWLINLGNSLLCRFKRLGDLDDLNQSVLKYDTAVTLTPDGHPDKPPRLSSLGSSLGMRFIRLGDLNDLDQSVSRLEAAATLTPDGHPDKPSGLNNLGNSLLGRFKQLGGLDDLNQSVLKYEAAVTLIPDGHPDKPSTLSNLGHSLRERFEQLHDPQDSQKLLLHYASAACSATGPASIRFHAAIQWAKHAHIHEPLSILHAYTTAIELLPELAWLGLSITDRHYHLSQAGQVVRDAASATVAAHDYKKAVEWLDQGRAIQALRTELVSLSTSLETAGTRSNSLADTLKPESLDSIAKKSHAFVLERNKVLQQIRELPGFKRFLLSKPFSELLLAAKMGPVAILNISTYGCDALILRQGCVDEVMHVPLSDFTLPEAQALVKFLASIVGTPRRSDRLFGFQEGDMAPDDCFPHILSVLWLKIVRPILDALAMMTPVSQDLGRIWWCPTGPLSFLPIHAAGLYGQSQAPGSKLSDFLISSYTPSLTALIEGFRAHSGIQAELQLLAVTQSSAMGQSYLPGTLDEIKYIQQHVKGKKVHLQWLDEEMATIDEVQEGMKNSRWVHFACHGVQSDSPTESALLLAGSSRLTLSNIIQLSLPNADLAFLSACQTATGSQELQDESVHLTAGMLLAGYRGVIGTMWSIDDNDAPQVAGDVYVHLFETSPPDPMRAAQALHLAVQKLRQHPGPKKSFLHWVPFVHFGV
ncbi:TPR-like protein [Mycena rebaudengoi]|nr:TPR-like protein [Mycena rebaudengoi]